MISIWTARPTTDWIMGRAILQAFCTPDPRLVPEELSVWSTQHGAFSDIGACAPLWAHSTENRANGAPWTVTFGMGWRRSHAPQYRAEVANHTGTSTKGTLIEGRVALHALFHKQTDWQGLFTRLCAAMGAGAGILTTHNKAGEARLAPLSPTTRDYDGIGSVIALPLARLTADHLRQINEAGFGVTLHQTCAVIALMPDLAEARADVPALEARQAELAAILNDGTWTPPKRASWWNDR